jgi:hypothetical protein
MGARLVTRDRDRRPPTLALNRGRFTVGSAPDSDVILADKTVSRRHATLEVTDHSCLIGDDGSTNGTFVNGRRVTGPTTVRDGDELRLGALRFVFQTVGDPVGGPKRTSSIWRRLHLALAISLILSVGATMAGLFVINFARLESSEVATPVKLADHSGMTTDLGASASEAEDTGPKPWLDTLNRYRQTAGVPAVGANPRSSAGAALHSRYLITNYRDQISHSVNLGRLMHQEDPSKPGFTADGAAAGLAGDVDEMWDPARSPPAAWAIDDWMLAPFHRISLLDPRLLRVGYGDDCESGVCVATLNAHSDLALHGSSSATSAGPIVYPPNGSSVKNANFTAEWPDPLTSCAGYHVPAGLPITLQLGAAAMPALTSYSLARNGPPPAPVEVCGIDAHNYANPDAATQSVGRELLHEYGAVIIIPRQPLAAGRYTATVTSGGQPHTWSFSVRQ